MYGRALMNSHDVSYCSQTSAASQLYNSLHNMFRWPLCIRIKLGNLFMRKYLSPRFYPTEALLSNRTYADDNNLTSRLSPFWRQPRSQRPLYYFLELERGPWERGQPEAFCQKVTTTFLPLGTRLAFCSWTEKLESYQNLSSRLFDAL